jgi:hypothetical protein
MLAAMDDPGASWDAARDGQALVGRGGDNGLIDGELSVPGQAGGALGQTSGVLGTPLLPYNPGPPRAPAFPAPPWFRGGWLELLRWYRWLIENRTAEGEAWWELWWGRWWIHVRENLLWALFDSAFEQAGLVHPDSLVELSPEEVTARLEATESWAKRATAMQHEDDLRTIMWRVTMRTSNPMVQVDDARGHLLLLRRVGECTMTWHDFARVIHLPSASTTAMLDRIKATENVERRARGLPVLE